MLQNIANPEPHAASGKRVCSVVMAHSYYIGASGHGKSTLLLDHILSDITAGHGGVILDPHGDLIDDVCRYLPPKHRKRTIYFDPANFCVGFNPLHNVSNKALAADAMLYAMRDVWRFNDMSTPTFDDYVTHSLLALMHAPDSTLLGLRYMLTSPPYRDRILSYCDDRFVKDFWSVFESMTLKEQRDETSSTRNKANSFLTDPRIRQTFGQATPSFTMSDIVTDNVLLCRLPQGQLGITKVRMLGMLLLAQLHLAILDRKRTPFHVYIDECHHFQGFALMEMLSGVRKFGVSVHLAHQYLDQLTIPMQRAIVGNITERYVFNVSRKDTEQLSIEDGHSNIALKYYELPRYLALCNGQEVRVTPMTKQPYHRGLERTIAHSNEHYFRSPEKVKKGIDRFLSQT